MKLRYRLFLWIGILFVIAFAVSFFIEEYVTKKSLEKTRKELIVELYRANEEKRKAIEAYIADMLWRIQANIDAVLQGIAKYPQVEKGFSPSIENLKDKTWLSAASLMITNQWLGFIQNTNENSLMSGINIYTDSLNDSYHFILSPDIHLVALRSYEKPNAWTGPYIGIPLELHLHQKDDSKGEAQNETYYVFFKPETILSFQPSEISTHTLEISINLLEPFLKWVDVPSDVYYLESFLDRIEKAKTYLETHPDALPNQEKWDAFIKAREKKQTQPSFSYLYERSNPSDYQKEVLHYLKQDIEHYNKVGLIWGISALTHSKVFGEEPTGPNSPVGMGIVNQKSLCGKALFNNIVFANEVDYDVEAALQKMETVPEDFFTTHLDVIVPKTYRHVFFGNTLKLKDAQSGRTGYLTLGMHGAPILEALARSTHQMSMFVSKGEIASIADSNGDEILAGSPWYQIPIQGILEKSSGVISYQGEEYFFLHITPYKELDLHFIIFNLKSKEFQFIDAINKESKDVIAKVSFQMRLASLAGLLFVLIFLNNISKRITGPITHLAKLTKTVAEGRLEAIDIPEEPKSKRHDEVYTLYHSFFEMVEGLKEKEKVRGVLNKVVSKEIAEETLKGNIQLGGEEKQVTVLFADIRNFTKMTENMQPKDVIKLINSCMTKASEIIDKYNGVIDKYVGDEVMALFGAPIEKKESPLHALKCAVDIISAFKVWNEERKQNNEPVVELGIGIHTGTVVAGNMGAENRLNYTVLGSNVNLASRLCSYAKPMEILISSSTLDQEGVREFIEVESHDPIELKGFTKPVPVFSVKAYKG